MGPHGHACIAFLPPYTCLRDNSVERLSVVLNEIEMMIEVWSMDYGSTKGKFIGSTSEDSHGEFEQQVVGTCNRLRMPAHDFESK